MEFEASELGNYAEVIGGFAFKSKDMTLNGYCPVIKIKNVRDGFIDYSDCQCVEAGIAEKCDKYKTSYGDILISMTGSGPNAPGSVVGRVARVRAGEPMALINQRVGKLIPFKDNLLDNLFLFYCLSTPESRNKLVALSKGSANQANIDASAIKSIFVPRIQHEESQRIGRMLSTFDDKIELNRKTNETLEAMAKALFKSWFVDFDPVRAKAEGRPTGLPAEISDLFPDSFEDSELGEIPSGWSIGTIGNAVGEVFDGPHATPKEASDGYVFLGIKNMTGTSLDLSEKRWIGLDDWEQWTKRVVPTCGDIVFTYEAALGLFAVIPSGLTCCLGRRMALIRSRGNEPTPYFWFHQFVAEPFQRLIEKRSIHGATVNRTPLTEFPQYPVLGAPIEIRNLFDLNATVLWSRIHLGLNEIGKLASARDALLPKLISGEILIPDAEKMLEEVGT